MSRKLLKSTFTVSGMTTVSRIFGLIRDVVIARLFGAGMGVDVFIVAFRIPNFLRRLFAEGGFSQAFVPVLAEYKEQRDDAAVKALVDQTSATLGLVLFLVTVIGVLAAPVLILIFAPGFDDTKHVMASDMLRITFPYILFISLTAFAGGIFNTYRQFAVPAFTPVLLNLSLISCAIWLAPMMEVPVTALAWGVLIAGIVQLLFQFPFLMRLKLFPRPGFNKDKEGVNRILKLMLPTLFAVSIVQINLLVDTIFASFLVDGSISWLYFSDRMVEFPLGVFGIALATVLLPNLSSEHAKNESGKFSSMLDWALRWVFMISIPAAVALAVLAIPVLATLFQYDEFTPYATIMSGKSLLAYSIGLPAFILIKVFATGFFSRQDTKTPVKIGAIAMVLNIGLNYLLIGPLAHAGLALATSLSACIQALLLFFLLRKEGVYSPGAGWFKFALQILVAVSAMAFLIYYFVAAPDQWFAWEMLQRVWHLGLWIVAGLVCYFTVLWLTGLRWQNMTAQH
jgi:putative peptidoglycan lipid II flippase